MEGAQAQSEFVLCEYHEVHAYFMHIEKSMVDLLKFYNAVLASIIPVSIALYGILNAGRSTPLPLALAAVSFVFFLLGSYILAMYVELRIRKIKTLEQIAVIRERTIEANPGLRDVLKMITSIKACPPYLRRPSSEWYTVIYLGFINGLAIGCVAGLGVACVCSSIGTCSVPQLGGLSAIALPVMAICWALQFLWATGYCYAFDLEREQRYRVKNDYSFLKPRSFPFVFRWLDWLAARYERWLEPRLASGEDNSRSGEKE